MRRLVSLPLAALFLLAAGGEAYGYHSCPHHDAMPGGGSERAEAPTGSTDAAGPETDDGAAGGEHAGGDHPCTCVGLCHGSAAAPVASTPETGVVSSAPLTVGFDRSDAGAVLPRLLPYVLPLANAPPHSR